jgi:hypothetical protein
MIFLRNTLFLVDAALCKSADKTETLRDVALKGLVQLLDRLTADGATDASHHCALVELSAVDSTRAGVPFQSGVEHVKRYLTRAVGGAASTGLDQPIDQQQRIASTLAAVNQQFAMAQRKADVCDVWWFTSDVDTELGVQIANDDRFERNVSYCVFALRARALTTTHHAASTTTAAFRRVAGVDNLLCVDVNSRDRLAVLLLKHAGSIARAEPMPRQPTTTTSSLSLQSAQVRVGLVTPKSMLQSPAPVLSKPAAVVIPRVQHDARFAVYLRFGHARAKAHLVPSDAIGAKSDESALLAIIARR